SMARRCCATCRSNGDSAAPSSTMSAHAVRHSTSCCRCSTAPTRSPFSTAPLHVIRAAREFAKDEFGDHRYVMVLHGHQANPHVHLSVKIESNQGKRLNPHKADLHRWRESFAERLRGWGI